MGILLIMVIIIIIMACITYSENNNETFHSMITSCIIVALLICSAALAASYSSYLDLKEFYNGTKEQYTNTIKIYKNKAILDTTAAFTDNKYSKYQENINNLIKELRNKIVEYTETLISKRAMKNSFMFNVLIVGPDENMKVILIKDLI